MLETITVRQPLNGVVVTIEALVLTVQGCRFILAINEYIEVSV
jgi:hypothetical protein